MGVNAKPNGFEGPRMDERGNWFNGNGKRIPDPGQNPNLLLASDQQDSLSKHSLPQRPMETVEIRNDKAGHGYYGAGRDGGRKHKGVDILAEPGSSVRSPIEGRIEIRKTYLPKIDPYNGKYTDVWIVDKDGNEYGLGYVSPKDVNGQLIVRNGQRVKAGDVVGVVQNRAGEDKKGVMKNHIHFMQKNKDKSLIDPTETVNGWLK